MHPISQLLCSTYEELQRQGHVSFALGERQRAAIDSIVKTVNSAYYGVELFPTVAEKAAAYLCYIIKDHPVPDGNKRLAVLWFKIFCSVNDLWMDTSVFSLDQMAVAIEKNKQLEMSKLVAAVRRILLERQ